MKGVIIPGTDHVARYCKSTTVHEGVIQASAFMLRPVDSGLSVNWLEHLERKDLTRAVHRLQTVFARKLKSVGATARFAVLNVGEMASVVERESPDGRRLSTLHQPEPDDDSHSEIYGLHEDDEAIAELMVELVRADYPARA